MKKQQWPVEDVRHWLEPGPVVLISSRWQDQDNIMTLGWHTILEFSPSLIGCMISAGNLSFERIRNSGECVINLPDAAMADTVAKIGNCSGTNTNKFETFSLTAETSERVSAPSIAECHANFECRLYDDAMVERYNFFIFEVVAARVKPKPEWPQTLHYTGDGVFRTDGALIERRALFTKVS
ncbi:flavin reductase [Superficieibacter electus]|uniref:Flavin reductase n=1 Tax=Superficieibacter electus TaxID=2022662 RepID=A0A2P5GSP3_9ENTR|nr:flavin reductase family protein [Superficieibacter electus]POP46798.1 flavin reductase [Superficieibacter electus]POP49536.1 flavin reductase [Superficieibacter electus]